MMGKKGFVYVFQFPNCFSEGMQRCNCFPSAHQFLKHILSISKSLLQCKICIYKKPIIYPGYRRFAARQGQAEKARNLRQEVNSFPVQCSCSGRPTGNGKKETKQQPSMLHGPAVPGSCLVSFHILWAILSMCTV